MVQEVDVDGVGVVSSGCALFEVDFWVFGRGISVREATEALAGALEGEVLVV